ncbi:MAG: hypothetical protein AAGA48_40840 [Myxococcota bacterium]
MAVRAIQIDEGFTVFDDDGPVLVLPDEMVRADGRSPEVGWFFRIPWVVEL